MDNQNISDEMLHDIIRHLDSEITQGSVRMSVEYDENKEPGKEVSHKGCKEYGREAKDTVNLLDMYTDMHMNETIDVTVQK